MIITKAARVMFPVFLRRKKSGNPTAIAAPKQRIWRLVRFKKSLLFTLVRSLGTLAYRLSNDFSFLPVLPVKGTRSVFINGFHAQCAFITLFARLPVLNRVKQSRIVYPTIPQTSAIR